MKSILKNYSWGLVLIIILIVLVFGNVRVFAKEQKNNYAEFNTVYFSNEGKTYQIVNLSVEPKEIAPVEGLISNKRDKVALINKSENSWYTDPYVYYYDIQTDTNGILINTEEGKIHKVSSWSPNDKYIVLSNSSQYSGGSVYDIYNVSENKKVTSFNAFTNYKWLNNEELVFTDPVCINDDKIPNNCIPTESAISILNLKNKNKNKLYKIGSRNFNTFRIKKVNESYIAVNFESDSFAIDINSKSKVSNFNDTNEDQDLFNQNIDIYLTEEGQNLKYITDNGKNVFINNIKNLEY